MKKASLLRLVFSTIIPILIHVIIKLLMFDGAQVTANSHTGDPSLFAILFGLLALISLVVSVTRILKKKGWVKSYFSMGLGLSLLVWVPVFSKIQCEFCAMA